MSEGKFFAVRSQLNGLVLDVQNNVAENGNPVAMWHYHGGPNQLFFEDYINGCIRSALDENFVLHVDGDSLVVNEYHPDDYNQRWTLAGDQIIHKENPSSVLDVADNDCEPGARVCSWEHNGEPNQLWTFEYQPPRYCYIRSALCGKVMDVKGDKDEEGVKVIIYSQHDDVEDNQLWYEDRYGILRSKLSDWAIDTTEGSARTNSYDYGTPGMQWIKLGNKIVNRQDPSQVLDVKGASTSNGTKLIAYDYNGGDNQHWDFEYL